MIDIIHYDHVTTLRGVADVPGDHAVSPLPLPMVTADISMARADREIRSKKEKSNQGYGVRACCDSEIHAIPGANESRGWPPVRARSNPDLFVFHPFDLNVFVLITNQDCDHDSHTPHWRE